MSPSFKLLIISLKQIVHLKFNMHVDHRDKFKKLLNTSEVLFVFKYSGKFIRSLISNKFSSCLQTRSCFIEKVVGHNTQILKPIF